MDSTAYDYETPLGRQQLLTGMAATRRLAGAAVLLCGLGGVGGWAAEALARSGVGHLTLVDFDCVKPSNLNRQPAALHSTLGRSKCAVMAERLRDIAPDCEIETQELRLTPDNIPGLLTERPWSAVADCIDDRTAKLSLLESCVRCGLTAVSSMGAAGKVHPECITTADISRTDGCPVARLMRKTLRQRGIAGGVTCVYSPEMPVLYPRPPAGSEGEKRPLGSIVTVTAAFGLRVADAILRPLLELDQLPHRGGWKKG